MTPPPLIRLLRLPSTGQLIVCSDLHGNLSDFRRMREIFLDSVRAGEAPFLLFSGDLIHGPNGEAEDWPEFLGGFYSDESGQVLEEFIRLQREFPSGVACLLGNHEHSHVGGPHTPKFWQDETAHFEEIVGPERTAHYKALFRSFPVVAVSTCGVAVTHAAPNVQIDGPHDIAGLRLEGFEYQDVNSMSGAAVLGGLLWSRMCSSDVAHRFLSALGRGGAPLHLVVYGHEIVAEGYERVDEAQLVLSTSFGVRRENRFYLKLDLAGQYRGSSSLAEGVELRRLYPDD
jgi:hypothetical protein